MGSSDPTSPRRKASLFNLPGLRARHFSFGLVAELQQQESRTRISCFSHCATIDLIKLPSDLDLAIQQTVFEGEAGQQFASGLGDQHLLLEFHAFVAADLTDITLHA